MKFILRWGINAAALYVAIILLPGRIETQSAWFSIVWLGLIFGLVNALLRPLLKFLTCPLIVLTLGLFTLVINTLLFALTAWIGNQVGIQIVIHEPFWWNAFLGALIVSAVSIVLSLILRDELKGKHRKHHKSH